MIGSMDRSSHALEQSVSVTGHEPSLGISSETPGRAELVHGRAPRLRCATAVAMRHVTSVRTSG